MKKLRLLFLMLAAAAVTFTACEPAGQGGSGEGEGEIPVIEFYPAMVEASDYSSMVGGLCYMITLADAGWTSNMSLWITDMSKDAATYSYLPMGWYSSVDCPNDPEMPGMPVFAETAAVVCNPGFGAFGVYDEATETSKEYYFIPGGEQYGVDVMTLMPNEDNNMLTFNLLAEDKDGNKVIIQGQFTGPLGYQVGPVQKPAYDLSLQQYGFTTFVRKDLPGGYVQLKSSSVANGDFVLTLAPQGGEIATADGVKYAVEEGNLNGYHWDSLDNNTFSFVSGQFVLKTTETAGVYTLENSTRNPLTMSCDTASYDLYLDGDCTITVTDAQ